MSDLSNKLDEATKPLAPSPNAEVSRCKKCNGTGRIEYETTYHGERSEFHKGPCNACGGTGETPVKDREPAKAPKVGEYHADYSELSAGEINAPIAGCDELFARSRPVAQPAERTVEEIAEAAMGSLWRAPGFENSLRSVTAALRAERELTKAAREEAALYAYDLTRASVKISALERRCAELEAALRPFAAEAEQYNPPEEGEDQHRAWASEFTVGEIRRAASALSSGTPHLHKLLADARREERERCAAAVEVKRNPEETDDFVRGYQHGRNDAAYFVRSLPPSPQEN